MNPNDYRERIKEFKAEGGVISKEYIECGEEQFSHLQQATPRLWKTVMSHRYILPPKLQSDYIGQEACDYLLMDFLNSYSLGILPVEHEVTHVHYINAVRALEVERPTYYVERDLAEALVRTDVPLDLQMQDIHWIYPQLRLYLPKGLLAITRNGQP